MTNTTTRSLSLSARVFYLLAYGPAGWSSIWRDSPPAAGVKALVDSGRWENPGRALDVGCGFGRNALYLAEQGWEVVGVDLQAKAVKGATALAKDLGLDGKTRFLQADATRLASTDLGGRFDLVMDFYAAATDLAKKNRSGYLQGVADLLNPGGVLLVYHWDPEPKVRPDFERLFEMESCVQTQDFKNADGWLYRFVRRAEPLTATA